MTRSRSALLVFALVAVAAARAQEPAAAPVNDDVAQAFARMDSNRDGQLSLEEFENGLSRPRGANGSGVVYQRLPARFRALDGDASGYLEAAEFAEMAAHWTGPGEAPELAASDRNKDGRIDFREFAALHAPRAADANGAATADTAAREAPPTR